jgi:hypothetical protein
MLVKYVCPICHAAINIARLHPNSYPADTAGGQVFHFGCLAKKLGEPRATVQQDTRAFWEKSSDEENS